MTPQPVNPMPDPQAYVPASDPASINVQEAHDRLKVTLEALPDLLFVLDRDSRVYDFHAPALDRLYVPPERFLGRLMTELLPEPAASIVKRAIADAVAHGHHHGSVYPLPTPGGHKWFEVSIAAQGDMQTPAGRLVAIVRDVTQRKQTEDALRESEERLLQVARQSRIIVWETDADGLFTFIGPVVEDVLGYRPEELAGKCHYYDLFPEAEREDFKAQATDSLRRQERFVDFEHHLQTKAGAIVWISTNAEPVFHADGTLRGYRGSGMEITARKRAEEALRESESRFDQSARQSRTAVWEIDPEGLYTYVSRGVEDVLGYRPDDLVGKLHFYDLHPENGREAFQTAAMDVIRSRQVFRNTESVCLARDGSLVCITTNGHPILNPDGSLRGYRGTSKDITAQKRAEEALRESEQRLAHIARQCRMIAWELDADGLYTFIDPVAEEIIGYRPDEIIGKFHHYDLHPEEGREAFAAAVIGFMRRQIQVVDFENPIQAKSGEIVWVSSNAAPLLNPDGTLRGYRGSDMDITARKRAEDALRLFKESVENASDAVGMSTPEGKHYYQNRAFDELFGAVGENPAETLYVDPAVGHEVFRAIMAGGQWTGEVQMYARDRRILDILLRAYANKDERGRITALIGIHTDITERKRAEEALRESEQRFEQSARQSRTYLWEVDADGLYTFVSPVVKDVLGYRPEQIVGRLHFYDLIPAEHRDAYREDIFESIRQHLPFRDYENPYQARDGRTVWLITAAYPLLNRDGTLRGYRGSDTDITARKLAREELRESEQQYRMLTESMKDVVWAVDVQAGRFLYVSPSVKALRGFTPEEILDQPLEEAWAPQERDQLRQYMESRVADFLAGRITEETYETIEILQPCKDGSVVPSEVVCHLVHNPDSGRLELHGVTRDISERKRMEQELRASEKKYRELHETMRDAFCLIDMQGRILEFNPAFLVLTGYSEKELRDLTYQDLTPEKWHAAEARIVAEQVLLRGYSDVYQKEYIRADGTPVPIELRTTLLRDDSGHPTGMWATIRDITGRLRIERALKQATTELDRRVKERTADLEASRAALSESEEQFRIMAESIEEVFGLVDAQTQQILYLSPAFESIWGFTREELGTDFSALGKSIYPEDQQRVAQSLDHGLQTGTFAPIEYRILRPDGEIRWIESRGWLIRSADGEILHIVGVMRDITDRRRLESEILNAAEAERQRIGRDLHDSLGQTLTGIGYLAEALQETLARDSRPEAAEAAKLAHLIEDVADTAHSMARGLLLVDLKRGGLAPALQELAFRTQELFGVACHYDGLAEVDLTDTDVAGQLYRIAQEAATNATKHGKGTTSITIGLERKPEGLLLTIRDRGQGLAETSTKPTGLGLDIMRYRAGLIGASLWIDSQPRQGTTVNCLLPRSTPPPENPT